MLMSACGLTQHVVRERSSCRLSQQGTCLWSVVCGFGFRLWFYVLCFASANHVLLRICTNSLHEPRNPKPSNPNHVYQLRPRSMLTHLRCVTYLAHADLSDLEPQVCHMLGGVHTRFASVTHVTSTSGVSHAWRCAHTLCERMGAQLR